MIKCKVTYKFQTKILYHWKRFGSQNFEEHTAIQHKYIGNIICSTYIYHFKSGITMITCPHDYVWLSPYIFLNFIKNVNSEKHKEDVNSYIGWICKTLFRSDAWLVGVLWRGVVRGVSVPQAGLVRRGWFISEVI